MPRALFLSPHLDDVAFSCGATLFQFLQNGWDVELITVFTASVPNPTGFALACQTDKDLPPDLDYMELRRAEDREFCRILGVRNCACWEFREAPHRGYDPASALFAEAQKGDQIWHEIGGRLRELPAFDVVFAPQGLGNHIDHRQVIWAVEVAQLAPRTRWYQDTPYAIRQPDAAPSPDLPADLVKHSEKFNESELEIKVRGCCAYESQIGFQFGGADQVAEKLREFHRNGSDSTFAERFLVAT